MRKLIRPYILRRLKTDKTVISDLPEKIEMRTYAALSKKQILLYKNLTVEIKETIARTEGIQRRGIILSSLMKFKQLCNHPDQYLGTGGYGEKEAGNSSGCVKSVKPSMKNEKKFWFDEKKIRNMIYKAHKEGKIGEPDGVSI